MARIPKARPAMGPRTIDYKSILGIAGTIIAALSVVTWGYISGDLTKQSATNSKQWELLSTMDKAHIRLETDTLYLKRDMEDLKRANEVATREREALETRLRAVEQRH